MRLSDKTLLITFYSYKGGVGRTMAVANAACQMANKHGKDVICVDWDLEAPGLHQYFNYSDEELADRPGLLDYLMDFALQVKRGAEGRVPELNDYIQDLKPEHQEGIKFGSVRFIHCGRTDADYMTRVEQFDWDEFYADLDGYRIIETLKKQLREAANVTLIDARAGQADVGVVPTIQVPDALVILFASNRQNLIGMEKMARSFHKHPQRIAQGLPEPQILLVPARVFHEEERFQKKADDSSSGGVLRTRIRVSIGPKNDRDRRRRDVFDRAREVLVSFRSYLMAVEEEPLPAQGAIGRAKRIFAPWRSKK